METYSKQVKEILIYDYSHINWQGINQVELDNQIKHWHERNYSPNIAADLISDWALANDLTEVQE